MDYPNDFNIKSFPAGKTIAFSRSVAIWISIVFFLIITMCGILLLGIHFKRNYPFLISIDPFTEEWSVITYPGKNRKESVQQYQIVQEKLVRDFVTDWFTVSNDPRVNNARWHECKIEECSKTEQFDPDNINCTLFCRSDSIVFEEFNKTVLPGYTEYSANGGKWTVGRMLITPTPNLIAKSYGKWQVIVTVITSDNVVFDVLAFITIRQNTDKYPATLGYYVEKFDSYRITDE